MSGTPPLPRGNDSATPAAGGGAGGYTPTPLPLTTSSVTPSVVGPNKLATPNDNIINTYHHHPHHHYAQQQQQQQQQASHKGHHRAEPTLPPQHSGDRWSTMLPMYHHQQQHHHQNRPLLDTQTVNPLENRPDYRGSDKGAREAYYPEHKEGYGGAGSINWKEPKDHYRVGGTTATSDTTIKRHTDSISTQAGGASGISENWDALRANLQTPASVHEVPSVQEREHVDPQEAVAENRIDSKGDDRYKEKDRKRKDLKHRDWGVGERDSKERTERRPNLQPGSGSGEGIKEVPTREEDKWDRDKKDPSKDREKTKEMEKDPIKRETWNGGPEKDGLNSEKESSMDVSRRTPEREALSLEQKKSKEHESWRSGDRERKKERDGDVESERPEKRSRVYEKESDDGCADTDGGTEREREGSFNYGVQQRKRMLRPRGSPQVGPRFRTRMQDNEGSQGKPEASPVVYRMGECMEEMMKLWKEYESRADKNGESSQGGPTLEIRIPAEFITATNRQVKGGQLWGTDVYTDDSDIVAVLMHTGYCRPTASPPPPAIQELRATVRVLPPQDCYTSTLRNNVRSRAWGAAIGCSFRVERCCIFKKGGGTIDLEPCLTHTSTVEPTLAPVAVERTMTTRAAASNALRQQRFVREVTIQYNLCNEPWIKYSLSVVADKGLKKPQYTSARLKKGEVLYLETHSRRYELCFSGEKMVKTAISSQTQDMEVDKTQSHNLHSADGERERGGSPGGETVLIDVFRWSRCKRPLPQNLLRSSGVPLPSEHLEVLEDNLDWEDIQWSQTGVFIAGKEYALARVHFMSPN